MMSMVVVVEVAYSLVAARRWIVAVAVALATLAAAVGSADAFGQIAVAAAADRRAALEDHQQQTKQEQ